MTSMLAGPGFGGNQTTSRETKALQSIDLRKHNFVNKDFVQNMAWLNQSVTTLSSYSQLLQKGVDQANQNFLEQIQGFIADLLVMFAGFEPTGVWSFGDLKHVIQGIGALLGINPDTPFPLNLAEAAWHLFNSYVVPLPQFTDLIFDAVIAWAETLGLSEEAVDAIQNFDNAVVALYNGFEDSFGNLGVAVKRMLNTLGLGGGWLDLGPLNELWTEVQDLVTDIVEGPQDLLLNILSKIVVMDFKAMTWIVNLLNPQNWLAAFGLNFLGPQILPEITGDTVDWTVTANANTGWIFDADTSYANSAAGSFKTNGNGSSKRLLTQDTFPCAFGESYAVIGQLKWDSIPAGVDSFGPCIVFYTGAAEIAQVNVDAVPGHGATGGWQQVTQSVAVPVDADGFRVGTRISAAVNTGTVWVDELSCSKSQSWDEALSSLLLSWTPVKIFQSLLDAFKGGVNGLIADVVNRIQHILPGSGLFDGGFISGLLQALNIPSLDASVIGSGQFAMSMINGLLSAGQFVLSLIPDLPGTRIVSAILASIVPALDASKLTTGVLGSGLIPNITRAMSTSIQSVIDAVFQAINGGSSTGNAETTVKTALMNIPGGNIISAILASIVPGLDGSKIISGTIAQTFLSITSLAGSVINSVLSASNIPSLDASKIGTGAFAQSFVTGLTAAIAHLFGGRQAGVNLVVDPDCSRSDLWAASASYCTLSLSSEQALSGTQSLKAVVNGSGYPALSYQRKPDGTQVNATDLGSMIVVQPGDKFYAEHYVRAHASNANTKNAYIQFYAVDSTGVNTTVFSSGSQITPTTSGWTKVSHTYTIPAGYDRMYLIAAFINNGTNGDAYYLDNFVLWETTLENAITSALGASGGLAANVATALANIPGANIVSAILAAIVPSLDASKIGSGQFAQSFVSGLVTAVSSLWSQGRGGTNIVSNPGFENTAMPILSSGHGVYTTAQARTGTQSLQITATGVARAVYLVTTDIVNPLVPGMPSDKYYAEFYVYGKATNVQTSGASTGVALKFQCKDSAGANISFPGISIAATTALNGAWTKVSGYITLPANTANFQPYLEIGSAVTSNEVYYFDDVMVREVTEAQNIVAALFGSVGAALSSILAAVVPGLDASKLITGVLSAGLIPNITRAMSTSIQSVVDMVYQAINGGSSTGNAETTVKTALQNIPGANIVSAVLAAIIPNLDASKITTGSLAQTLVSGLSLLNGAFFGSQVGGTNLAADPDGSKADLWSAATSPATVVSTEQFNSGTTSIKLTIHTTSAWAITINRRTNGLHLSTNALQDGQMIVIPGEKYYCEYKIRSHASNVGNPTIQLQCNFLDSVSLATSASTNTATTANSSGWTTVSHEITVPATRDRMVVRVLGGAGSTIGDIFYVDDMVIREVTPQRTITNWLNGSISAVGSILAAIVPSLDASKITTGTLAQSFITNLATDLGLINTRAKDYESLVAGSGFEATNPWPLVTGMTVATDQFHNGTKSLKMTGCTGGNSTYPVNFEVQVGDKIYMELWARRDSAYNVSSGGADGSRFRLVKSSGSTFQNIYFRTNELPVADTWYKLTAVGTVPSDIGTHMNIVIFSPPSGHAGSVWIDDITVRRVKAVDHIVDLPGTKIISSVLAAVVPALDASIITTGTLVDAFLPGLGALRDAIVQAIFGGSSTGYTAANVKTHMTNVADKSINWVDGYYNALTGASSASVATSAAAQQAAAMADLVVSNASAIAALQAQQNGGFGGIVGGDDFERTDTDDLGTDWSITSSTSGSSPYPIFAISDGHNAAIDVVSGNSGIKVFNARRTKTGETTTTTDYQVVSFVTGAKVMVTNDSSVYNSIIVRMSSDGNHYVKLKIWMNNAVRFYYTTTGISGETAVGSTYSHNIGITPGQVWSVDAGTAAGLRIYRARINGVVVLTWDDSGTVLSSVGASYRGWGFGGSGKNDSFALYYPSTCTRVTVAENSPAATVGQGFRVYRNSTSNVSHTTGKLANSFFDTTDKLSTGWTFSAGSNNGITIPFSGWYIVELRIKSTGSSAGDYISVYVDSNEYGRSYTTPSAVGATQLNHHATFLIHALAGSIIYPGIGVAGSQNITGSNDGVQTYFMGTYIGPQPAVVAA